MPPSRTEILLGNGAIARGIVESGCRVMTAYPGTPSSEILAEVTRFKKADDISIYTEWSTNEKVALETALAVSFSSQRAAVAMKQVGLNVASDPLLSAAYTGVAGGLVVIACDDPGPHSSQTEQDTRLFALFAKVPVFDPSTPRDAKAMVKAAFDLSEEFEIPVLLRPTTRVCHAIQNITFEEIPAPDQRTKFKKDPARWAATPRFRNILHHELNDKLAAIEEQFNTSPFNQVKGLQGSAPLGLIIAGACASSVSDILNEAGLEQQIAILQIGTPFPLPQKLIADFIDRCDRVVILEEPDYAIEIQIRDKRKVSGRLDGFVPSAGELVPEVLHEIIGRALQETGVAALESPNGSLKSLLAGLELPISKPRLCPGCAHRSAFFNIKRTIPGAILPGDIGCYTLGLNLRAVDTVVDMGASITMASGFYHAHRLDGDSKPIVATIGDSTFFHSGPPGLTNAVHTGARFILVILDNGTTAMTGMQPTAQNEELAFGSTSRLISIKQLAEACGVEFVRETDPYDYPAFETILKEAFEYTQADDGGVAVIIAKRACVLYDKTELLQAPVRVEVTEECDGCKYCLVAFECPALVLSPDASRVDIDRRICVDCGQCIESCYKGFIVPDVVAADS